MKQEKYLQVYDATGKPGGQPQHLKELGMPEDSVSQNWEGLCWHKDDQGVGHVLLVNDTDKTSKMLICRVRPPEGCHRYPP